MAKGTAIDRVLQFYRTASADTVRVTHQLAEEVMEERGIGGHRKVKHAVQRGGQRNKGDKGGGGGSGRRTAATSAPVTVGERAEAAHGD